MRVSFYQVLAIAALGATSTLAVELKSHSDVPAELLIDSNIDTDTFTGTEN